MARYNGGLRGSLKLDGKSGERIGETVRDAISRRSTEGIYALVRDVNSGAVDFDMGYRCMMIIVDIVSPFVTYDVKQTLDQALSSWRSLAEQKAASERERSDFVNRNSAVNPAGIEEVAF